MLTILIFFINNLAASVFLLVSLIIIRIAVKIPFKNGKYLKNIVLLAVIIVFMQMIFGPGDTYMAKSLLNGLISLKWEGFLLGLVIACRLFALLMILPVLTDTTPGHQIAAGLCSFGMNHKTAILITTAFNLIPFFKEEATRIIDAQKLRGLTSFEKKTLFSGIKAYSNLLVPLMLGAMQKAQSSSIAMDSRAFGIHKTRTWIDKPQMNTKDFWIIGFCALFTVCVLIINFQD